MSTVVTRAEQNLALLQSLIPSGESFNIWCYTNEGQLLGCSCHGTLAEYARSSLRLPEIRRFGRTAVRWRHRDLLFSMQSPARFFPAAQRQLRRPFP